MLPETGYAITAIRSGEGTIACRASGRTVLEPVRDFGPTLYAPLRAADHTVGLLMLWREPRSTLVQRGRPRRPHSASRTRRRSRSRSRNLATSRTSPRCLRIAITTRRRPPRLRLTRAVRNRDADRGDRRRCRSRQRARACLRTLDHVKRAQHEVRGVMGTLSGQRTSEPLSERIRRELVMAEASLGFMPTVQVDWAQVSHAVAGDPSLSDDVVAVVRELLSNVARHAQATAVHMTLDGSDGRLCITISDNGIGPAGSTRRHSGTSNIANRALRRNGNFTLSVTRPASDRPGTQAEWNVEASG